MKFCDVLYMALQVILATFLTTLLIIKEFFFAIVPRKQKSVKDEVIVVTGAGHGLGRRIAIILAKLGAHVVCWDINKETNINTVYDIKHAGGRAVAYTCDVRDREAVLETAEKVRSEVGPVTMLINNAGVYPVRPIVEWSPEELRDTYDTNIMAHYWTLKAFLPSMTEQNYGHIVSIASAAAIAPVANEVPYSSSKAAASVLMDGLVQELRLNPKNKVKVTCVHPYYAAVRDDIPVKFDLRIERLSPDYVAAEIVKGIRQNRQAISVPRFMFLWIAFMRCLPEQAKNIWRDIFYTRVWPIPPEEMAKRSKDTVVAIGDKLYPELTSQARIPSSSEMPSNNESSSNSVDKSNVTLQNGINLGYASDTDLNKTTAANENMPENIPVSESTGSGGGSGDPSNIQADLKEKTTSEDTEAIVAETSSEKVDDRTPSVAFIQHEMTKK